MESKIIFRFLLVVFLKSQNSNAAQTIPKKPMSFEECTADLKTMEHFSMRNFTGKWFELYAYPFCLSRNAKCVTTFYTQLRDNRVQIYTKSIENYRIPKKFISFGYMKENFLVQENNPLTGEVHSFQFLVIIMKSSN